jgi:hypothetical protein
MSDPVTLRDEDVGRIGEYVKPWLRELVSQLVPRMEYAGVGPQLLERMVRVEEELKAQRELMSERFGFMERRFEMVEQRFAAVDQRFVAVDQRFEAVDQRFEDLIRHMDRRFESVDKRFTALTWMIGVGFVVVTSLTTVFALLA